MEALARFKSLILDPATLVVFTAGFLVFTYGLVVFMDNARKGGDVKVGREHMLWGIAGMFIMVATYGIINIIASTIGVDPENPADTSRIQNIQPADSKFFPVFR